jgi:exodeoxyribonuclease VIII
MNLQSYHNDTDAISKSGMDKIDSSPLDYWWHYVRPEREPYTPDKDQNFNDAFRMAVFAPKSFADKYVRLPEINRRTNIGKAEFESFQNRAAVNNHTLITASEYDIIKGMQQSVLSHPVAQLICSSGSVGFPSRFVEENSGANVKYLPHFVHMDGFIVNLISTKNASESSFIKEAQDMRYDKRAAVQMDGTKLDSMVFVQVENKEPYKIGIFYLDSRTVSHGRENYLRNCQTYVECLESGKWPGFPSKPKAVGFPEWFFYK